MPLRGELRSNRDELVIGTKGGLRRTDTGVTRDADPHALREGVDASLTALGVDHIDLYQVHWPDPKAQFADKAGALKELVDFGKIRHVDGAIVGTRHADHVEDNLAAADITLGETGLKEIDSIMAAATPVVGPSPESM